MGMRVLGGHIMITNTAISLWLVLGVIFIITFTYHQFEISAYRTDCVFSPNDKLLMTGISVRKDRGPGKLVFLDRTDLEVVNEIPVCQSVSYSL